MAGKFALIIGNSQYQDPNLTRLKAPEADVNALSALLRDPLIGAFDDVITLANELSATIRRTIAHFFAQRMTDDLLVLYFSGHGVLDDRGELFLATKDTERELISGTAIPAAYITGEMDRSRSKRQVLILDCCHSGAFARGTKGIVGASVGTASAFQGTGYGRVVLTATDATQFAWEGDQVIGSAVNSLFTHYMIEGLRTGEADADGDGRISIENLYDYIYDQVVRTTPNQTPGKWSYKQQGEIVIANNPKPVTKPAELPRELRDAIDDARPWVREGAVAELERLLKGRHPGLALAAQEALKRLRDEDDSIRVKNAATQVLETYEKAKPSQGQAREEQERRAREQAEAERAAGEKAEQERVAKERAEAERLAREKAERERIAKEQAEAERLAREKAEADRIAREKAEKVAAQRGTVPESKAVAAATLPNRRRWLILGAGIAGLFVLGILALALIVLASKAPTPAPTVPVVAIVPTASPSPTPTIPPTLVPTPVPASVPTAVPPAAPTLVPTPVPTPAPPLTVYPTLNPARPYFDRGYDYYKKGDLDRALADYNQALILDPKYIIAYINRGVVYYFKGDLDRALADFTKALSLDPKFAAAYINRGEVYYDKGDLDRALADYNQALSIDSKYASAYYDRGLVYRKKGSNAQAIADFQTYLQLKPDASERANVEQWIQELKR